MLCPHCILFSFYFLPFTVNAAPDIVLSVAVFFSGLSQMFYEPHFGGFSSEEILINCFIKNCAGYDIREFWMDMMLRLG